MADSKITALTSIGASTDPANDPLVLVDVSDTSMAASGTTKKVTLNQLLGAGGTATLASTTITGDLTVDTSTLKVDSANDRVGIGTASPAQFVHLSKSSTSTALTAPPVGGASLRIQNTSSTNNNFGSVEFYNANGLFGGSVNCQFTNQATPTNDLVFVTRGSSGGLEHYRIAADGVCTWSEVGGVAGTAMTLNSTGLGVGVSPSGAKLCVDGGGSFTGVGVNAPALNTASTSQRYVRWQSTGADFYVGTETSVGGSFFPNSTAYSACLYNANSTPMHFYTGGTLRATIDTSGNVGVGVAPSAWSGITPIQISRGSFAADTGSYILSQNVYNNGSNRYIATAAAMQFRVLLGTAWQQR